MTTIPSPTTPTPPATTTTRRSVLASIAATGILPYLPTPTVHAQGNTLTAEQLERAANEPVLDRSLFPDPVIIDSIRLLKTPTDYIVHVRSKDGAEGISITNTRAAYLYPIFNRLVAPTFMNRDARDLEVLLWENYRAKSNYKLQGLALWCPTAWLEFAILDMLGRVANQPIGALLGGVVRKEADFYIASGNRDTTPQEEVEYLQQRLELSGAHAVKFRVGGRMSKNADASPGRTPRLIELSRKFLGDDIDIHADSNSSYDPPQAIEVGRMLEDINAVYFEEPCPFDHLEDTKRVTDALTIPVSGGEQEYSDRRFRWMIQNRAVDIVQPDLHYYGGLIRSRRVARMAELANMPTTVHISGGFGFVYMLHFTACTNLIGRYQEYKLGTEKYAQYFDPPISVANGNMSIPTAPGVGITNTDELLKNAKPVT